MGVEFHIRWTSRLLSGADRQKAVFLNSNEIEDWSLSGRKDGMKNRFVKEVAVLGILAVLGRSVPVHAGWQQQEDGWRYEQDGNWVADHWVKENQAWYYLDQDGKMAVGWKQIGGLWYFFNPVSDETCGKMMTGWQWIDGRCYYLAQAGDMALEGSMYAGRKTPDGYWVEESGAWADEDGKIMEVSGKGILTEISLNQTEDNEAKSGGSSKSRSSGGGGNGRSRKSKSSGGGKESRKSRSSDGGGDGSSSKNGGSIRMESSSGNQEDRRSGSSEDNKGHENNSKGLTVSKNEIQGGGNNKGDERDTEIKNRDEDGIEREDRENSSGPTDNSISREGDDNQIMATSSNAQSVKWYVRFVDEDTRQIVLAETRQGKIADGEDLLINFQGRIVDSEGQVWESVVKPPLTAEVYGPGDWIYDVTYRLTGKLTEPLDPERKEKERLYGWLDTAKEHETRLTGEEIFSIPDSRFLVFGQKESDRRILTAASQVPAFSECVFYVIGVNTEPNGIALQDFFQEEIEYSERTEDSFLLGGSVYTVTRFSVKRRKSQEKCDHLWETVSEQPAGCTAKGRSNLQCKQCRLKREVFLAPKGHKDEDFDGNCDDCKDNMEAWQPEAAHWDIGDVMYGEIDKERYAFRCIDQNYSDQAGNHRQGALFLCDSVIPANIGSGYSYEPLEDGSYGYVFCPGPVVNFGDSNDYKYSNILRWLQESEDNFPYAEDIEIGISAAYAGSTGQGMYSQLQKSDLKGSHIGNQKLTGRLFILSVDEALKYSKWLWRFDGSQKENPESQTGMFSEGYWLRSPMGTAWDHDTNFVYMVDLVNGVIRPTGILPEGESEDEELRVTCSVGVRPAFVMPQE